MKKTILLTSALGLLAGGLAYFFWGRSRRVMDQNKGEPSARKMIREGETRIHSAMHRAKKAVMVSKNGSI